MVNAKTNKTCLCGQGINLVCWLCVLCGEGVSAGFTVQVVVVMLERLERRWKVNGGVNSRSCS